MVKGPSVYSLNATHFRDAIVQCYIGINWEENLLLKALFDFKSL